MTDNARYVVGIDLGTTNTVVFYADTDVEKPEVQGFSIPQLQLSGEVREAAALPSFGYVVGEHDGVDVQKAMPWAARGDYAVGAFARDRGAEVPGRLVAASKSWLCHTEVDRLDPILPQDALSEVERISPVEATARVLDHVRRAWNAAMAIKDPGLALEQQQVFLTVPASFDATARMLTLKAADDAGFEILTLLEEPLAAFYAWLYLSDGAWREQVAIGDRILVWDVGGGTTDFTIVEAKDRDGELYLERTAVGNHILLGGDNMDLTLARVLQQKLAKKKVKLDRRGLLGLCQSCRAAKESLLGDPSLKTQKVTVAGGGSKLVGGSVSVDLSRKEVEGVIDEGFFPACAFDAEIHALPQSGLQELGLPFEADPAVTHHLATFLRASRVDGLTGVLFNGGVMKAAPLRKRVLDLLESWFSGVRPKELAGDELDLAVARGAAFYGLARRGKGVRVRADVPRTYYIGIEAPSPAVPGFAAPLKALCVVPRGLEEGSDLEIPGREFQLRVGAPVRFRFLTSTTRPTDKPGVLLEDWEWEGDLNEIAALSLTLPAEGGEAQVRVRLHAKVTELGVLELWCQEAAGDREWKLEYSVRKT